MALSGSLNTSGYQGRNVKFSWTATQNTSKNQSTISWTLEGDGTASSSYYNAGPIKLYIDGVEKYSKTERIALYDGTVIKTGSFTLTHGSDGKKSFKAKVEAAIYSGSINCTGSKTFTLNTIARGGEITSAPNIYDTSNPKITFTNPSGSAAKLSVALVYDNPSSDLGYTTIVSYVDVASTATSYTFNLTDAQRQIIQRGAANSKTLSIRYFLRSVIGTTTLRDEVTRTCTIASANPVFDATPTVIDAGTAIPNRSTKTTDLTGDENTFIRYFSTASYTLKASAKKSATVKSSKITSGAVSASKTFTTATVNTTGTLANVESKDFKFTVTDSRDNIATKTISKKIVNYVNLTCYFAPTCLTPGGTVNLRVSGKYYPGSFGVVDNYFKLQYRYSLDEGATWGAWTDAPVDTPTTTDYVVNYEVTGLDYKKVYRFQVRVYDQMQTVASGSRRLDSTPIFDWGENDFKFNVPMSAPVINGYNFGDAFILWSGTLYMSEGHTANLGGSIMENCHSGIVLIFSRYDKTNGVASNQQFSHHFVPKYFVWAHGGAGSAFNMRTSLDTVAATKYLYISDTKITGHANNIESGTGASGIKYDNSYWVLRYVVAI